MDYAALKKIDAILERKEHYPLSLEECRELRDLWLDAERRYSECCGKLADAEDDVKGLVGACQLSQGNAAILRHELEEAKAELAQANERIRKSTY